MVSEIEDAIRRAEAGDVDVQVYLGLMYELGIVVPENLKEAARWWRKAAEAGNVWACETIAAFYETGKGVAPDLKEAERWRERAALLNRVEANDACGGR